MGNGNLSKVIADGLSSPPGSSKRRKAASILKTFNKNKGMDGMGGGAIDLMSPYNALERTKTSTPSMIGPSPQAPQTPQLSQGQIAPQKPVTQGRGTEVVDLPQSNGDVTVGSLSPSGQFVFPSPPTKRTEPAILGDMAEVDKINIPEEKGAYYDQWYGGLSPEEQSKWKPLYDAVTAGVGPSTFAWEVMGDTNKLKQMLPGVPEDALPQGASLSKQVNELESSLRDEFKLEQLSSNVQRMQERGMTITDDLKGYVTARDKYIEKLDNMIDGSRESMVDMDMANPYVKQRMGNYMNYLYLMKGRQQKRYIDMVNSSIDYHNQELTRADNSYNEAYSKFTNELKNKTEVTKEEYGRFKTMLEEMYDNISGKEKSELEIQKLRESVAQAQYQTAIDAAEALTSGEGTSGWGGLTKSEKAKAESKYIESSDKTADEASIEFSSLSNAEKLKSYSGTKTSGDTSQFYAIEILKGLQHAQSGGDKGSPSIYYSVDKKTGEGTIRWDKLTGSDKTEVQKAMAAILASQAKNEETKEDIKSNPLKWIKHFFGRD